jgi:hypothetical protein
MNKKQAELGLGLDGLETRPHMACAGACLRSQRSSDRPRDTLRQRLHLLF